MGFFDAIGRGFALTQASIRIVLKEPWMFFLPIISGIILFGLLASFILLPLMADVEISDGSLLFMIIVFYFVGYFLFYFTQSMIICGARERFEGKDPTIGSSFSGAVSHLGVIVFLAVIGATIGLLTSILSSASRRRGGIAGFLGQLLASFLGASWTILSYFSLPVILNENLGAFQSFSRSVEIIKRTWGESIVANLSLMLLYAPGIILLVLGIFVIPHPVVILLGAVLFVIGYILSIPVKGIISQALYVYATKNTVPTGFEEEQLKGSFQSKSV